VIAVTACAVCGSTKLSPFSQAAPGPDHLHSAQVRCRTCGVFISQPRADVPEMDTYYRSHCYETHWADAEHLWQLNLLMHQRHTLPALDALAGAWMPKPGSRVLEIGCGYGSMLTTMSKRGYRVIGSELSAKAAAFCRSKELDVVISRVPPVRPGSFDIVIARHLGRLLREAGCSEVRTMSFSEQADRESLHWRLYKGLFRTIDRAMGGGELLAAAGRLPLRGSAS